MAALPGDGLEDADGLGGDGAGVDDDRAGQAGAGRAREVRVGDRVSFEDLKAAGLEIDRKTLADIAVMPVIVRMDDINLNTSWAGKPAVAARPSQPLAAGPERPRRAPATLRPTRVRASIDASCAASSVRSTSFTTTSASVTASSASRRSSPPSSRCTTPSRATACSRLVATSAA